MDPNWVTKQELEGDAIEYVTEKGVGPLLEGLMKELIVAKPDDPVAFMIQKLKGASWSVAVDDARARACMRGSDVRAPRRSLTCRRLTCRSEQQEGESKK